MGAPAPPAPASARDFSDGSAVFGAGSPLGRAGTAGTRLRPGFPGPFPQFSVPVRRLGALASVISTLARPTPGNCEDSDPFVFSRPPLVQLQLA